jgi:lambda family phage portal protein
MIGRALDSVIGVFSPERAVKRTVARAMLQRAYDGAKGDRLSADWKPSNRAADLELLSDADTIRARARDLVRNNAYAKGIINARRRNIIGCGIYPQSRTTNERFNAAAESLFDRWQKQCDVTGRLSFYELQGLCQTEMDEAGECLVHFVKLNDPSRVLPLALELIEADRLISDSIYARKAAQPGNEIRRGVEIDRYGRPVAYHIWERNPNDLNSFRQVARRIPAEECVHLFRQERIDQTRGISLFAPVVLWLHHLKNYMEAEQISKRVASCFGVAIETMAGPADGGIFPAAGEDSADTNGNSFDHLEAGIVARLFPGEKASVINPGRSEAGAQTWITLMLRSMAVGTQLSYERLTRDYSQTNYSSNRAADLEDRRDFRPLQEAMIRQLCEPVWRKFLASAVEADKFTSFPDVFTFVANYDRYAEHVWQAPGWEWVDPVKEVTADILAVEKGFDTLADSLGRRGKDWRDVLRQRKVEQDFADKLELRVSQENVIPLATAVVEAEEAAVQNKQEAANADEPATA